MYFSYMLWINWNILFDFLDAIPLNILLYSTFLIISFSDQIYLWICHKDTILDPEILILGI